MQRDNTNSADSRRRTFLKAAGTATAALATGVPLGAATNQKPTQERYLRGQELRHKNNWDVHQWRRWLANNGFEFQYQDVGIYTPVPDGTDSETGKREWGQSRTDNRPTRNKLDKDETWHHMTYTRPYGAADRFDFEWSLNDGWDDSGASPRDWPGMSFEHDYYNFDNDESPTLGNYVSLSDREDDLGSNYWAFEYNEDSHAYYTSGRFESHFDVPLYVESSTDDVRQIWTKYHHTWDNVSVDSIGVDSDDVLTVNFSNSTDRWVTTAWCEEEQMDDGETYTDKSPY